MKKLEINDKNLNMYKEYLDIQNNNYNGKMSFLWFLFVVGIVAIPPLLTIPYAFVFEKILLALSIKTGIMTPLIGSGVYLIQLLALTVLYGEKIIDVVLNKFPKKLRMKKFLKKYPDFDKELSEVDIEKAVKEYSKAQNDVVKTKETSQNIYDNDIYSKVNYVDYQELEQKEKPKVKSKIYPRY